MQSAYETKIRELENKVETLEAKQVRTDEKVAAVEPAAGRPAVPATSRRQVNDNSFNPEIGVILQGKYQGFSEDDGDIAGFAIGEEAERGTEGLSIDETELTSPPISTICSAGMRQSRCMNVRAK